MEDEDNVISLDEHRKKKQSRMDAFKSFLNKPAGEVTVGDTLLIQALGVTIASIIPLTIQGWVTMMQRRKG